MPTEGSPVRRLPRQQPAVLVSVGLISIVLMLYAVSVIWTAEYHGDTKRGAAIDLYGAQARWFGGSLLALGAFPLGLLASSKRQAVLVMFLAAAGCGGCFFLSLQV